VDEIAFLCFNDGIAMPGAKQTRQTMSRRVSVETTALVSTTEETARIKNVDLYALYEMFGFRVTILRQEDKLIIFSPHPRVQDMLFVLLPFMGGFVEERVQVKIPPKEETEPCKAKEWCPPFYSH
jgi:virulence-associated protein VagC